MTLKKWTFALLALAPSAWLGCSGDNPAVSDQTVPDSGADARGDGATRPSDAGDGGSPDGDAAGNTDAGGDSGVTGPLPEAGCDPNATWSSGTRIAASTADDDLLDSITPDELSIAWTGGPSGSRVVYYADRASTSDAFGGVQSLATNQFTADRVALSPDGLRLVVVDADPTLGFSELTRTARMGAGNTFASPTPGGFTNINADTGGKSVGDPVVGSSDTSFYYSLYGSGATTTVYRSLRLTPADPWGGGAALNVASGLLASGSQRRRPTGISSDNITLFFFDEVSSTERAAWVNQSTGSFDTFADLGARTWAAPSTTCATLYYTSAGTSMLDLFFAMR